MSRRLSSLLVVLILAVGCSCPAGAVGLPAAAGVQAGRPVRVAASVPRAREAGLLCGLGTPVIGGTLPKGACEAGEELAGQAAGGLAKEVVGAAGGAVMDSLSEWMIGAATTVTGFLAREMQATTTPRLGTAWFEGQFAPMADLGAALGLLVALIALASAAVRRDPRALAATLAGIVRAGLGTGLVVALSTLGLQIADEVSNAVLAGAPHSFWGTVARAWGHSGFGGFQSSALASLIALVEVFFAIFVLLELIVRDAGLYVAVLFFPVVLAASIWPALSSWSGRLARILLLLIVLKPVALIVLCLAGSAAAAGLSFGEGFSGSVGTILVAIVIFALAAFAPWVLMYLLAADAEAAYAGIGLRAGAGAAVAGGQGRSLANAGGLRGNAGASAGRGGQAGGRAGGSRPPGGGGGGGGGGGRPSGGAPGGSSSPASAAAGTGAGAAEPQPLTLDGAAVGAGSLGAAAGHNSEPMASSTAAEPTATAATPARTGPAAPQSAQPTTAGQGRGAAAPAGQRAVSARRRQAEVGSPSPQAPPSPAAGRGEQPPMPDRHAAGSAPVMPAPAGADGPQEQGGTLVRLPALEARSPSRRGRVPREGPPGPPERR